MNIEVPLQPKQAQLLSLVEESPATWIAYGGSRGGAKSHGLRAVMLLRRLKHRNTRGLIFRRTYEQLWDNHLQPLFAQYPFMRDWYHNQHRELTLPNGSYPARFLFADGERLDRTSLDFQPNASGYFQRGKYGRGYSAVFLGGANTVSDKAASPSARLALVIFDDGQDADHNDRTKTKRSESQQARTMRAKPTPSGRSKNFRQDAVSSCSDTHDLGRGQNARTTISRQTIATPAIMCAAYRGLSKAWGPLWPRGREQWTEARSPIG